MYDGVLGNMTQVLMELVYGEFCVGYIRMMGLTVGNAIESIHLGYLGYNSPIRSCRQYSAGSLEMDGQARSCNAIGER
jgi:hypothetical protein